MALIGEADWTNGTLSTPNVPIEELKPLTGGPEGHKIWKSNNPEVIKGDGWLMQNARPGNRGSSRFNDLSGTFGIYLFHINKSLGTKYLHVLVTNPQNNAITLNGKGSMFTNAAHPLQGRGTGLNYMVSRNWLDDTHRIEFQNMTLDSGKAYTVDQFTLSNGTMIDGRFELTASAGVFVYTVVTSTGNLIDAINASQGGPAAGDIFSPGPNKFGREAGICGSSIWAGKTQIEVPTASAHLGLCLNTSNKFAPNLQDQTAGFLMRLSDSADRTNANYGHKYDVTLELRNPSNTVRKVRLSFASNLTNPQNRPSFTYNGPIQVNNNVKDIFTTPADPTELLDTFTINASTSLSVRLQFFIPGLITIGQQLLLESI